MSTTTARHRPDAANPPRALGCRRAVVLFATITVVLLAADLAIKSAAFARVADQPVSLSPDASGRIPPIPAHDPVVVVPKLLALHLTANEGAVFGLGRGGRWFFVVFSVIASSIIVVAFVRSAPAARILHLALAAVLAGALGNLYDRLRYGVVRDMLWLFPDVDLPFGWRWPDGSRGLYPWIFNFADACLVVGLLALMILMYRHDRQATAGSR